MNFVEEIDPNSMYFLNNWLSNHTNISLNNDIVVTPIFSCSFSSTTMNALDNTKKGNITNSLKHVAARECIRSNYDI